MIIELMKESDKGRRVVHVPYPNKIYGRGTIIKWDDKWIYVQYDGVPKVYPTTPEDLEYENEQK